jgi:hypothetical protein
MNTFRIIWDGIWIFLAYWFIKPLFFLSTIGSNFRVYLPKISWLTSKMLWTHWNILSIKLILNLQSHGIATPCHWFIIYWFQFPRFYIIKKASWTFIYLACIFQLNFIILYWNIIWCRSICFSIIDVMNIFFHYFIFDSASMIMNPFKLMIICLASLINWNFFCYFLS